MTFDPWQWKFQSNYWVHYWVQSPVHSSVQNPESRFCSVPVLPEPTVQVYFWVICRWAYPCAIQAEWDCWYYEWRFLGSPEALTLKPSVEMKLAWISNACMPRLLLSTVRDRDLSVIYQPTHLTCSLTRHYNTLHMAVKSRVKYMHKG